MFADAIKNDRHANVILFENVYKFLGYERYDVAVKQLKKLFPGMAAVAATSTLKWRFHLVLEGFRKIPI